MNGEHTFTYAEIKSCTGEMEVEFANIVEFASYAEKNKITVIFILKTDNAEDFLFIQGYAVYKISAAGYRTIEDYKSAFQNKFPDSITYYEALKAGFASFAEFEESKKVGAEEKETFLKAKKTGFIEGFEKFIVDYPDYLMSPHIKGLDKDIDSPLKLYKFAKRNGFENYNAFYQAIHYGFTDVLTYNEAHSKGFQKIGDYLAATNMGFENYKEFMDARSHRILNKKEYNYYLNFKKNIKDEIAHDEYQLIEILGTTENGKVLSSDDIKSLLNDAQEKYKIKSLEDEGKKLPKWYTQNLKTGEALSAFLQNNPKLKKLGFFDKEKETFEIFLVSNEKIYIDASNVAYNSNGSRNHKPKLCNIKYVINELISRNYKDITIIADASLRHNAEDVEILRKLPKDVVYIEAPAHTTADEFLINSAKRDKCFIVTNDTFKDWKRKDRWIANNIDYLRIPFMIKDTHVILSGLDKTDKE